MMNYRNMTTAQLLAEKSHMEQIGAAGDVYLLEIAEELTKRRQDRTHTEVSKPAYQALDVAEPLEIRYTRNARAVIYPEYVDFYAREAGEKRLRLSIGEVYQDRHLISFYKSEYLTNGIKARVLNKLGSL